MFRPACCQLLIGFDFIDGLFSLFDWKSWKAWSQPNLVFVDESSSIACWRPWVPTPWSWTRPPWPLCCCWHSWGWGPPRFCRSWFPPGSTAGRCPPRPSCCWHPPGSPRCWCPPGPFSGWGPPRSFACWGPPRPQWGGHYWIPRSCRRLPVPTPQNRRRSNRNVWTSSELLLRPTTHLASPIWTISPVVSPHIPPLEDTVGALKPRWKLDRGGKLSGSRADEIFRAPAVACA